MTIKECLYRELRFELCGAGGALHELVDPARVKLDMRTDAPEHIETDYPFIIFRRITESEDNQVNYARDRFEFEIIGLRSSATKGDELLEQIKDILKDHFMNRHKTFGKFDAEGVADPSGGLRLRCRYFDTVEGYDDGLKEKCHIMIFFFTYVRS